MQALKVIRIATSVSQVEMPALDLASKLMRESMRDVVKQDVWSIQIENHKLGGAQKLKQQPSAVVCSMLQEITNAPKTTTQIEMNWRASRAIASLSCADLHFQRLSPRRRGRLRRRRIPDDGKNTQDQSFASRFSARFPSGGH